MLSSTVSSARSCLRRHFGIFLSAVFASVLCSPASIHAQSPLSGYEDVANVQQNVFYLGADLHIHLRYYTSASGWQQQDVTTLAGAPAAAPGSAVATFKDNSQNQQHVVFETANGHIFQLFSTGNLAGWLYQDVSAATNSSGAAVATPLVSFADSQTDIQYVAYLGLDQHVRILYWNRNWGSVDGSAAAQTYAAANGSQITGFVEPQSHVAHVFFEDTQQHVRELYAGLYTPIYTTDLTVDAGATFPALATSVSANYDDVHAQEHLYYLGVDGHVHHLQFSYPGNHWSSQDLTLVTGSVVPAAVSNLASIADTAKGVQHVFYVGLDQHVHQIYSGNNWAGEDITNETEASVPALATPLTSFQDDPDGQQHAFYFGQDTHLYHFWYAGSWYKQDLTPSSIVPSI